MPALGRLYAPDPHDANYPMRALLLPAPSQRTYRYWYDGGAWLDQGNQPACVGFGWTHWWEDGPATHPGRSTNSDALELYHEAQELDEWPGHDYEGTSVRGGAKAMQARGRVGAYHWAVEMQDIIDALLEVGPVVVGTNWYEGMMTPDPYGMIHVNGDVLGGHCYVLNGVNTKSGLVRVKNSWGREWGIGGHAFMTIEEMSQLLAQEGEACLAIETRS